MRRILVLAVLAWAGAAAAATQSAPPSLSVAQIVAKNAAARGGADAWRKVSTMAWLGHVQVGRGAGPAAPFRMQLERPNKTHFEVTVVDKRFARIFDGEHGWRVRPGAKGGPEVKAFSREEEAFSRSEFVVDGPLLDYETKGVTVKLVGLDELDGRKAYLLDVKLPGGAARRVWIDAQTFLDVRTDRPSTSPMFKGAPVSTYYRDYRSVDGLQIPFTLESRMSPTSPPEKLVIDRVAINPKLPDLAFAKPAGSWQRHAIVRVGGEGAPTEARADPAGR